MIVDRRLGRRIDLDGLFLVAFLFEIALDPETVERWGHIVL